MSEKGRIKISTLLFIIIAIVVTVATVIVVTLTIKKSNGTESQNNIAQENIVENTTERQNTITELDEGITQEQLPKVDIDEFAEENSTIDGKIPAFYNPVIPQGFKAIGEDEDETIDENAIWGKQNSYLNGLVIEDKNGNQFVWIPVENMDSFKRTDWQKNAPKENINLTYIEPLQDEEEEYQKMYYKVKKYGGFYVGRYETGDLTATGERTTAKNTEQIGIKKFLNAYNYVPFKQTIIEGHTINGAQQLAVNFGKQNKYKTAVTSVVYGVQWDSILRFIASEDTNVNNSLKWGNYTSSEITYEDIEGNEYEKESDETRLLKTGASEDTKAKNIYDIAGNLYEWTMEASGNDSRIVRGGCYVVKIAQLAAARFGYKDTTTNNATGFRISFYVK